MRFTVPGIQVSTNRAYRSGRGRFWMNAEGTEFKQRIEFFARQAMKRGKSSVVVEYAAGLETDVHVDITFYFQSRRPDIDGPTKLVLDAMQGVVYANDRQIVSYRVRKELDAANPRTEIEVVEL